MGVILGLLVLWVVLLTVGFFKLCINVSKLADALNTTVDLLGQSVVGKKNWKEVVSARLLLDQLSSNDNQG